MITRTSASKGSPHTLQAPFVPEGSSSLIHPRNVTDDHRPQEVKLDEWWTSGKTFARQEEFYQSLQRTQPNITSTPPAHLRPVGPPSRTTGQDNVAGTGIDMSRLLVPVLENLASYVQGPIEKRRDYFSQWSTPAEWMIDNSPTGNQSFYDKDWGTPPARVGRDPRYASSRGWSGERATPRMRDLRGSGGGGYGTPAVGSPVRLDRRFAFVGRY